MANMFENLLSQIPIVGGIANGIDKFFTGYGLADPNNPKNRDNYYDGYQPPSGQQWDYETMGDPSKYISASDPNLHQKMLTAMSDPTMQPNYQYNQFIKNQQGQPAALTPMAQAPLPQDPQQQQSTNPFMRLLQGAGSMMHNTNAASQQYGGSGLLGLLHGAMQPQQAATAPSAQPMYMSYDGYLTGPPTTGGSK